MTVRVTEMVPDTVRKQAGDATCSVAPGFARMTSHTESHWIVLKFGGTSVSSVSNWRKVTAQKAPSMNSAPWAKLMTPRVPKTRVRPRAISA